MRSIYQILVVALMLLMPTVVMADSVTSLISRLEKADDFRIRVKAALALGKSKDARARQPLERSLSDQSAAVRAACAAALRVLGDERSIAALEKHKNDKSASVRAQVRSSIAALKRKAAQKNEKAEVLVKLGEVTASEEAEKLRSRFRTVSRRKLDGLPGVVVLEDSEDAEAIARQRKVPLVLVTARLQKVATARDGSSVLFSARVQYVVHTMPDEAIVGLVSGEASARASASEARDAKAAERLRREVLTAAVESAVRRAPAALKAAAQ